jgi:hypothetical protein
MNYSVEVKLRELRGKTNRQLMSLISHKLDSGLAVPEIAEEAYCEASQWIQLLNEVTPTERRRLDMKLSQLRATLDRCEVQAHAAC